MRPILSVFVLLLALAASATAAPYEGARWQEFGGHSYAVYAVPGALSVTWASGVGGLAEDAPLLGPAVLSVELEGHRIALRQVGRLGAARYATEEYRAEGELDREATRAVAAALLARQDVAMASPLWTLNPDDEVAPWAVTEQVLVRLRSGEAADERALHDAAEALGLEPARRRGLAPNQWALRVPRDAGVDPIEASMALGELGAVLWSEVDWLVPKFERFTPADSQFSLQWHHNNTGQSGGTAGNDMRTAVAWDTEQGDASVLVVSQDSGVDTDHEDLVGALQANPGEIAGNGVDDDGNGYVDDIYGWDFANDDNNPNPSNSSHGTSVAGTMAAPANGIGVVGGCPGCSLLAVRMLGASNSGEAEAHDYSVLRGAAVINNSWGPSDSANPDTPQPIPNVVATAVENAVANGRGGKGTMIFWAAGNGNNNGQTCSQDGYVSHPDTIGVTASTNLGGRASYSEACPEADLNAPSAGGTTGITTTRNDTYTNSFGGTSAASPNAASVAALVISALPDLTAVEVLELLESTATAIDPAGGAYDADGHSDIYGYGRVDAEAALQGQVVVLSVPSATVPCDAEVSVTVSVPTGGASNLSVNVSSLTEPGPEVIVLTEGPTGVFTGMVRLTGDPAQGSDGLLSVVDGDSVTVESLDAGDTQSFAVDCVGPVLFNFEVREIAPRSAVLVWETNEPADGAATWEGGGGDDAVLDLDHLVVALDLEPCTVYAAALTSTDASGASSTVANALTWRTPGDATLIPDDAPDDADPCDPSTWSEPTPGDDDDDDDATGEVPRSGFAGNGGGCSGCGGDVASGAAGASWAWLLLLAGVGRRRRRGGLSSSAAPPSRAPRRTSRRCGRGALSRRHRRSGRSR